MRFCPMYVALRVADVHERVHLRLRRRHGELGADLVHRIDERLRRRIEELAEREIVDIERQILRDRRQPRGDLRRERHAHVVDEIVRVLQIARAEQLEVEADADPAHVRVRDQLLRVRQPRVVAALQDVLEAGPLDVVAAVLDHPVDDPVRVVRAAGRGLPEREVPLDRMQRVKVHAAHAELRRVGRHRESRVRRPSEIRGHYWHLRIERMAEHEPEVLERRRDAVLRAEHVGGPHLVVRVVVAIERVALGARASLHDGDRDPAGARVQALVRRERDQLRDLRRERVGCDDADVTLQIVAARGEDDECGDETHQSGRPDAAGNEAWSCLTFG